jgi:hypothetical protein
MAELADEELQGVVPKQVQIVTESDGDIGCYYDEHGNKHWGVIPKRNQQQFNYNNNFG